MGVRNSQRKAGKYRRAPKRGRREELYSRLRHVRQRDELAVARSAAMIRRFELPIARLCTQNRE